MHACVFLLYEQKPEDIEDAVNLTMEPFNEERWDDIWSKRGQCIHWDWFVIGGRWDGYINDNSCRFGDINLKTQAPWGFVTPKGRSYSRNVFIWDDDYKFHISLCDDMYALNPQKAGPHPDISCDVTDALKELQEKYPDWWVVAVDIHY